MRTKRSLYRHHFVMIRSIWRALKRDGKRRAEQNADKILSFKSDQTRRANVKLNFTDKQLRTNDNICGRPGKRVADMNGRWLTNDNAWLKRIFGRRYVSRITDKTINSTTSNVLTKRDAVDARNKTDNGLPSAATRWRTDDKPNSVFDRWQNIRTTIRSGNDTFRQVCEYIRSKLTHTTKRDRLRGRPADNGRWFAYMRQRE